MTKEELVNQLLSIDKQISTRSWITAGGDLGELIDELREEINREPSLSANLEEAAKEYAPDFSDNIASKAAVDAIRDAFKAGAEWMEGQGVKIHGRVLPGRKGNAYIESDWFDNGYEGLSWNDEVEIIIQKRQ